MTQAPPTRTAAASAQGPRGTRDSGSILAWVDDASVSSLAKKESRNRETFLPPLGTFRWWARRTGAVNDAILTAAGNVFGDRALTVIDPFAGGGTIPLVALRAGHKVHAQDINPWAAAGIRQMLSLPPASELMAGYESLLELAQGHLDLAYATNLRDGSDAKVVHTYRVAVGRCGNCAHEHRQFPYSLLTLKSRKERGLPEGILACPAGHVFEGRADSLSRCPECNRQVDPTAMYTPRRVVTCPNCGAKERLSTRADDKKWRWEVVLIERAGSGRREFDLPTSKEINQADRGWNPVRELGAIPRGSETNVLLRHGFTDWGDLYPRRQRAITELLMELSPEVSANPEVVSALRMAIVGSTEFAGHLSRWDRFYLKCNDATAGHRFNFSTFVPEINVAGAHTHGRGTVTRRVMAMARSSDWLLRTMGRPLVVGSPQNTQVRKSNPDAVVACGDSAFLMGAEDGSADLVLTDPPYHDDVHYGELSLPFRSWASLPLQNLEGEASTNTVTGTNVGQGQYSASLLRILVECRRKLKSRGRLVFSYANNEPKAWVALFSALQAAGFQAVACLSLHSENETDFKKRNVNSYVEDLVMEFSPSPIELKSAVLGNVGDDPYMGAVAELFRQVGFLEDDWEESATQVLLVARSRSASVRRSNLLALQDSPEIVHE